MIFLCSILMTSLLTVGLFRLAGAILVFPSGEAGEAILMVKGTRSISKRMEAAAVEPLARLIARLLHMSEYRKRQLSIDLARLNITDTPELYTGRGIAKTVLLFLGGFIFIPAGFPVLAFLTVIIGILLYFKDKQDFTKKLHRLNRQIESELPRMVETLNYSLPANRDIILFFEKYRYVAGKAMERELNRLLLDMKTGNPEAALREWDARLGVPSLSAFVGILCCSYQGIDQHTNLLVLEKDIRARERETLRREVQKRPGRVKSAVLILTLMMILLFMVPLALMILKNIQFLGL